MKIKFNINQYVLVKLTEDGKKILREDHYEFWRKVGRQPPYQYSEPKEDSEGYSKFQLWDLMSKLGPYCTLGFKLPFDTEIIFITE